MLNDILHKKVKPWLSYAVLVIGLIVATDIAYQTFTSPLLFFNPDQYKLGSSPYPASPQEYKQQLLEQAPVEAIVLGKVAGKPNFKDNISQFDKDIRDAAKKYKVDCTLIKATILAESRGKPNVRSGSGAVGLMQLMPLTARAMGYASNLSDPRVNIMAGTKYMALLKERACYEKPQNAVCNVNKDVKFRLAAYNGGPKCNKPGWGECSRLTVWECIYYDAYAETRFYVEKVKANYQYLKQNNWGC
jgi:soluble lytic murein transglycosylase-like protein